MDADPAEVLALATIYRDAFAVLDVVGWTTAISNDPTNVPLTAGHVTQLRRLRSDLALAIVDRLAARGGLTSQVAVAEVDSYTLVNRMSIKGLGRLLAAYEQASKLE
jgi:hypothetical protein